MKTKENKKGISLIVLVMTIIVIIILATAIIVTILDSNPIESAKKAVDDSNIAKYTEQIEQVRSKLLLQNENHELPNLQQMKEALEKEKWVVETEMIMDEGIEKLKIVSKEGYIFYITGDDVEYKGKGEVVDTSALKRDDVLELVAQEETVKGQYVKITNKAEDYYVIKYKIGEEENNWTEIKSGEKVEVPYGKTIYAKLFYGSSSGVEFKLKIGESNPSIVAKNTDTSNMKRKTDTAFANLFDITWGSEGTGSIEYEVTGNMLFKGENYSNTKIENIKELELGTYNVKCTVTSPSGYETSAQKQVVIKTLASTTVINASNSIVNANAIYSQYDMAYFRDIVNGGQSSINVKLMDNINLSNVCSSTIGSWTPIANIVANENLTYNGIFDGDNKTISGLYISNTSNEQGLFGKNEGIIKNIKISGSINANNRCGSVTARNYGKIVNCHNNAQVRGNGNTGGIAGYNYKEILQCSNTGTINSIIDCVGGIVGCNETGARGIIKESFNKGTIISAANNAGGIVGYNIESSIYNCYNTGTISGNSHVGGISGAAGRPGSSTAYTYNCYNIGRITGNSLYGSITGMANANGGSSRDINCYSTNATVAGLNSGAYSENSWKADKVPNINSGYPILYWQ